MNRPITIDFSESAQQIHQLNKKMDQLLELMNKSNIATATILKEILIHIENGTDN
jgi:hypothetical protein